MHGADGVLRSFGSVVRPWCKAGFAAGDRSAGSGAGRRPWDVVIMIKTLVPSGPYNLSDDQIKFRIPRPAVVHARSRPRAGGQSSGCKDGVALARGAGEGRQGRGTLQPRRWPSRPAGLHGARRADTGCIIVPVTATTTASRRTRRPRRARCLSPGYSPKPSPTAVPVGCGAREGLRLAPWAASGDGWGGWSRQGVSLSAGAGGGRTPLAHDDGPRLGVSSLLASGAVGLPTGPSHALDAASFVAGAAPGARVPPVDNPPQLSRP